VISPFSKLISKLHDAWPSNAGTSSARSSSAICQLAGHSTLYYWWPISQGSRIQACEAARRACSTHRPLRSPRDRSRQLRPHRRSQRKAGRPREGPGARAIPFNDTSAATLSGLVKGAVSERVDLVANRFGWRLSPLATRIRRIGLSITKRPNMYGEVNSNIGLVALETLRHWQTRSNFAFAAEIKTA
jgi:hypothetical protein